jgi:hypothetical protein
MAQVPIIRRKPEGQQPHLLVLTIDHPTPDQPPQANFHWDGEWVQVKGFPPAFAQQVFLLAFQVMLSAFLVVCGNVVPPQGIPQEQQN